MIYEVLNFLRLQLDRYLSNGRINAEPLIVLSNPWTNNDNSKGSSFLNSISLISVEEEKVFKTQGQQIVPGDKGFYVRKEPDLKLNLYILISAYNKNYEDGLKFISKTVTYFQVNSFFDRNKTGSAVFVSLPNEVEKIVMELYTASFEQQNQIWASLSTGYIPSVIYKVKTIVVDSGVAKDSKAEKSIREINISTKFFQPE